MSKFFKPVFDYKLSFDPNKGDKYTIKVVYTVGMDAQGRIGAAIPPPAAGENPPVLSYKTQTRSADVRICKSKALDEILFTIEMFKRARKVTRMNWAEAILNFSNCMGPIPQMKLDELYDDHNYPQTEAAFNGLLNMFIRDLCVDEDAKGTLKQNIEKGNWIKPEDVEIQDHSTKVIHLFNWMDQVPGFHQGPMTDPEKYRLYVATYPIQWAKQFQSRRGFTNATSYETIDEFMQTQKDDADRSKKKRKKEEESNNRRNTNQRRNGSGGNRNRNTKTRIDRRARTGPTSKCKKHPDANHAWGDCHLNPNNPNNKLGDRNSDRNSNRNGDYNRNNRYDRNNNNDRQQRQSYYGDDDRRLPPPPPPRDNYSNQGPPSQVSVYSNQSNNNDNQGGRWSRVWIPS